MFVEAKINRRDLFRFSGSTLGYLGASVTAKNLLLTAVGVEAVNAYFNAKRTIESFGRMLKPNPPYDAIVILGAGNSIKNGREVPSPDGQMRVIAGVEEYLKGKSRIIRFAGGARSGTPEGRVMAQFAEEYAMIPISAIQAELLSVDTVTNLLQIIEWKKKNPDMKKIAVSTNAYHMPGVQVLGNNLGLELYPVVAEQSLVDTGKPELIKRVRDLYGDPSYKNRIEKEQARLVMLLLDPESHIAHDRIDWQDKHPAVKFVFDKTYEALAAAGKQLFPLEVKSVI
jgi:hypothetical protein